MNMIIAGKDCEDCIYATLNEEDKSRIPVYCEAKDRKYIYGQCIPCELKQQRKQEDDSTEEL